jgi:phosphatidylglycerophosphate synthase
VACRAGVGSIGSGSANVRPEARSIRRLASISPPWDQRLARAVMEPFAATGITPNQITTLSLGIGWLAAWLYAHGGASADVGGLCFMVAFWLDHADGELARMTGRTSTGGHYYDLAAGGAVLVALFIGIGIGERAGPLGAWSIGLGGGAGLATAVIFALRMELERHAGKAAVRQPSLLGFEIEDVMYLVGPITWLGLLQPFVVLAGIGAPLFALLVLWQCRGRLVEGKT